MKPFMKPPLGVIGLAALTSSAKATPIDFGTTWAAWGSSYYSTDPGNRVLDRSFASYGPGATIATYLNSVASTSFSAANIQKTDSPTELGGTDGYFEVPSGWNWLVVQYNGGNNAGALVIKIDGLGAKVPFDSSNIWGSGDQFAVSHYAVAGPGGGTPPGAPDGGTTIALLGIAMFGADLLRRRIAKA